MKKPFDLLAEFGKFGHDNKISLRDPGAVSAFSAHTQKVMAEALDDPVLLQGQRTEAMFESLLISLGDFNLLKAEDSGRLFPTGRFRAPDFRVTLNDERRWLIEVKNVYQHNPHAQRRRLFKPDYYKKLQAYAEATGAELRVAVYWARWRIWTLVDPSRLLNDAGELILDMQNAMMVNELSALGDLTIGAKTPIRLRLTMDEKRTSRIAQDGTVKVTIGGVKIFCGDEEINSSEAQQILWIFMQYGTWSEQKPHPICEGDRLKAIEYVWKPEENINVGFEMIGTLSHMFTRYYLEQTQEKGKIVQLRAPLRPDWFKNIKNSEKKELGLSLWQFKLEPNYDALEGN